MSEKRTLALLGLLLGLLAGALLLVDVLQFGRGTIDLAWVLNRIVDLLLAVVLIFGGVLIFRGSYVSGGVVNIVIGIIALVLGASVIGGVLGLLSGVLGLVANEARY